MWPLGKLRMRQEDNNDISLVEIYCKDVNWIEVAKDHVRSQALMLVLLNLWVPLLDS
jgi:hypothetical protein